MNAIICPSCGDLFELYFDESIIECSCGNRDDFMELDEEETEHVLSELQQFGEDSIKVKEFLINYTMQRR